MALYRSVNISFWTDTKVVDDYTPEDKYFMLYAMTNQYTNIIGCYEISIKQMSNDLGYSKDAVESLLKRFTEVHKTIEYDFETKELMIINWHKYNWNSSPKLDIPLYNAIENVKSSKFHNKLAEIYNDRESIKNNENDMVSIPYVYGSDTTNTITNTISNTNTITINNTNNNTKIEYINIVDEVVNYLNERVGSNYKSNTPKTRDKIKARINEGFTLEDFKRVIDIKFIEWKGTEFEKYLRPETLFGTKFESYLNQKVKKTINEYAKTINISEVFNK